MRRQRKCMTHWLDKLVHGGIRSTRTQRDAKNLSIDARPGGCFCEKLPNGGGVEHARVVYVAPREVLRLSGALGPLQGVGCRWKPDLEADRRHRQHPLPALV